MSNTIDILDSESDSDFFSPKNIYKDQKRKSSTPSQGCVDVNPDLAQSKHPQNTPRDEKSPSIPPFISDSAKNINCKSAYFSVSSETESNGNSSDTEFGTSDAEDNETDKETKPLVRNSAVQQLLASQILKCQGQQERLNSKILVEQNKNQPKKKQYKTEACT